jgi:diaminopimelate epimerase
VEQLTLTRYEAQGNDFLIALLTAQERKELDASLAARNLARPDLARAICDRNLGVGTRPGYAHSRGADGFIVGVHDAFDGRPAHSVRMHLLNADGSFAETSGNGLACLALAAHHEGRLAAGPLQRFETDAGEQRCTVWHGERTPGSDSARSTGRDECLVEVAMPPVVTGPVMPAELEDRIRGTFGGDLRHLGTGSVGNPHLVIALARPPVDVPVDELSEHAAELGECVTRLGRIYEEYFQDGINVEFIWPFRPNPLQPEQAWTLQMSVWERGAGLTVSCGSGSVVAATLAHQWGFVRSPNDPPGVPSHEHSDAPQPGTHRVDMRTAPHPSGDGSCFQYRVDTAATSDAGFVPPMLGVTAECIETGTTVQLDRVRALPGELAAMTAPKLR